LIAADCMNTQVLTIDVTKSDDRTLVCLGGRVTIDSSPDLRKKFLGLLSQPAPLPLTVDLSELRYIDCSGIATLLEALRIAHQRHTNLALQGVRDAPRHLLEVTGLLRLFDANDEADHSPVSKVS